MTKRASTAQPVSVPIANPWLAAVLAWLLPGLGHVYLGRKARGAAFCVLVLGSLAFGCALDGRLPWQLSGTPLVVLATLGGLGSGIPYVLLGGVAGYSGDVTAPGYEYGGAFILTAGLMNLLLVLDAWDIAWGKELEDEDGDGDGTAGEDEPGEGGT